MRATIDFSFAGSSLVAAAKHSMSKTFSLTKLSMRGMAPLTWQQIYALTAHILRFAVLTSPV
jgi:hypothetical protein